MKKYKNIKIFCLVLAVAVFLTASLVVTFAKAEIVNPQINFECGDFPNTGDVNDDGMLTAEDSQMAFLMALELFDDVTLQQRCAADCNDSGYVSASDAQEILYATLEIIESCHDPIPTPSASWEWEETGNLENVSFIYAIAEKEDGSLYAGGSMMGWNPAKVFKSTNEGESWTDVYQPAGNPSGITAMLNSQDGYLYVGTGGGASGSMGNIYKTIDGLEWSQASDLLLATNINEIIESDEKIYVAASKNNGGKFFKTEDGGGSWSVEWDLPGNLIPFALLKASNGELWIGTYPNGQLFKSANDGESWEIVESPIGGSIYDLIEDNGIFYAATLNGYVIKSSDFGESWQFTEQLPGIAPGTTFAYRLLKASDGYVYVATGDYGALSHAKVFRTNNEGNSWEEVSFIPGANAVYSMIESSDNHIYIGTYPNGNIFKSSEEVCF